MLQTGTTIRQRVFERDKGVCARCHLDTEKLRKSLVKTPRDFFKVKSGQLWQAHHTKPVFEGGGCTTDLRDLETLCTACHQAETAEQRERRERRIRTTRMVEILTIVNGMRDLGATSDQLAFATGLSGSTVSKYLKLLNGFGYVTAKSGEPYFLTDDGRAVLKKVAAKTAVRSTQRT